VGSTVRLTEDTARVGGLERADLGGEFGWSPASRRELCSMKYVADRGARQ
jgi:hypothetical protein